ncbi:type II toxin-antitoxin system antitoxin SocA domain-containing protein [Vagococcus fluvialis]|uniref:type II toxin-antitoxin system antitoxin SocA domain-containing protein n=1 Tax=Vagococcus fluvialis TaxID=2738 RepID=UPI003B226AF8
MEKIYFCEHCRDEKEFKIVTEDVINIVKGVEFSYLKEKAICLTCNEEMYIPEVNDKNIETRIDAYRETLGLITNEDIKVILKRYNIGKKPLSKLLGWGELTISRYLDGSMPTKEYSDILKKIKSDPFYYYEKLNNGEDNISSVAYNKSIESLSEYFVSDNISLVTYYILSKEYEITPLALQKLLYYINAFNLAFNNKAVYDMSPEAWVHGPVFRDVYFKFKNYQYNVIDDVKKDVDSLLEQDTIKLIDAVLDSFGLYSPKVLENMTHLEDPWNEARGDCHEDEHCRTLISEETTKKYFKGILEEFNIKKYSDMKVYSEYLFSNI